MCQREDGSNWLLSGRTLGRPAGSLPSFSSFQERRGEGETYYHAASLCHPVQRYLNEYQDVRQGVKSHWRKCSNRRVVEKYPCGTPNSLDSFMQCPNNPAVNRMSRLLSYGSCTFTRVPEDVTIKRYILDSAMLTLENMTFVGVDEFARSSEGLLFYSLNLEGPDQHEFIKNEGLTNKFNITQKQLKEIVRLNELDMKLYYHALRVMSSRAEYVGVEDGLFAEVEFPTSLPGPWDSALEYFLKEGLYLPK